MEELRRDRPNVHHRDQEAGRQDGTERRPHQVHEYFHGDTGAGLGASHQTGWTGLVADLVIRRSRTSDGGSAARI